MSEKMKPLLVTFSNLKLMMKLNTPHTQSANTLIMAETDIVSAPEKREAITMSNMSHENVKAMPFLNTISKSFIPLIYLLP